MYSSLKALIHRRFMLLYPLALLVFLAGFIGLHHLANQVPQSFVAQKLASDFRQHNLAEQNYPFSRHGSHSVLSNIGQNQYTECAVLLSVLSSGETGLRNAVLPLTAKRNTSHTCAFLKQTVDRVNAGESVDTRPLRTRYWWGARPVYSSMLRYFSVYQTRELIRNATALAYTALAVSLVFIAPAVFWVSSPLLLFGLMFSGQTYYSEVILGVPYLWAIVAATVIAALHAARIREPLINLAVFCAGLVSSYLWLLDGHLILLFTWLIFIGYFASARTAGPILALAVASRHLVVFSSGFVTALLAGQLIKAGFAGVASVWGSLGKAIEHRSSDMGPGRTELDLSIVFNKVWGTGYWWTGLLRNELLWQCVVWGSVIAGVLGVVICLARYFRGSRRALGILVVCVLVVLSVLMRLYFLQNHSVIHAFFIGRYMFIPLAAAWVLLLGSILLPGVEAQSSPRER